MIILYLIYIIKKSNFCSVSRKVLLFVILAYLLGLPGISTAQDTVFAGRKNKIGFTTGSGFQYIGQLIGGNSHAIALHTTYYYRVTFYQLQYYCALSRKHNFDIDLLFQPQYNLTKYKQFDTVTNFMHAHEFGLNTGVLIRKNIALDTWSFYLCLSTGPHYASGTPHRQANGFLFSNSLFAGVNLKLYKSLYADFHTGIRHISNAKFKYPNGGINAITINEGLMVVL